MSIRPMGPSQAGLAGAYAPFAVAKLRRLVAKSRTVNASPPTVTDGTTHGITSAVGVAATVAENLFMSKTAGGSFSDIGSGRITAGQTNPGTAIRNPMAVELYYTCGAASAMAFQVVSAPGHVYRLWVDDAPVTAWASTTGAGGGATRYIKLAFAAAGTYKVRLEQTFGDLVNIIMGPTDTIARTNPRGPRCIVVGDSYTGGAGASPTGYDGISSWVKVFAELMGWENVWNSGIGGTGYIAGSPNYQTRAAGIVAQAPDIVIVQGGKNDIGANTAAQIGAAAGAVFQTLRAGLPTATLICLGPIFPGASTTPGVTDATWGPVEDALFAAVAPYNVVTVSTKAASIFTGTGKAGATTGSGNGDYLIQSDGAHPTPLGVEHLGRRLTALIAASLY